MSASRKKPLKICQPSLSIVFKAHEPSWVCPDCEGEAPETLVKMKEIELRKKAARSASEIKEEMSIVRVLNDE